VIQKYNPSLHFQNRLRHRDYLLWHAEWVVSQAFVRGAPSWPERVAMYRAITVDLANYRQESPRLTPQTLKEAFDACFNPALGSVTEDDWARPQTN